ncbi:hypothetical protein [Thermodesulfobacterium hydrogeniphilum]|uniref:hypothetical protein n=1 Tax=Thermodesulfobacterium hydrogeniphilum TaxID=161156 RepID=UPI000570F13D|nr:hypothetical protein [Thermodesulfobacterium hydrogeniphilum]
MIVNKALHYKPDLEYNNIKSKSKKKKEKVSFKELLKEFFLNVALLFFAILTVIFTAGIAYKSYILFKLKKEVYKLTQENQKLVKKYQYLTSRDIVLEKAKKLGLRPPQNRDYLRLE